MIDVVDVGRLNVEIVGVISNCFNVYGLMWVENVGIKMFCLDYIEYVDRVVYDVEF